MNRSKNLIELKHYMNPIKNKIELKHYMNPTSNTKLPKLTVQTFFWFVDIGGIVDHHCLNSDGQQFYQYQQTKRMFKQ